MYSLVFIISLTVICLLSKISLGLPTVETLDFTAKQPLVSDLQGEDNPILNTNDGGMLYNDCGGVINSDYFTSGVVMSPNYPNNYPNNITCTWTFQGGKDKIIYLKFDDFELESGQSILLQNSHSCRFDFVYLYEEYKYKSSITNWRRVWGFYCGRNAPPDRVTNYANSKLVLYFRSDATEARRGFRASYYFADLKTPKDARNTITMSDNGHGGAKFDWLAGWYGEDENERVESAFTSIIFIVICVILFVACINYCKSRQSNAEESRQSTSVTSAGSGWRSFLYRRNNEEEIQNVSREPPAYEEIIKNDDDLQAALNRIGTTREAIDRYRSLNVEVTYNVNQTDDESDISSNSPPSVANESLGNRIVSCNILHGEIDDQTNEIFYINDPRNDLSPTPSYSGSEPESSYNSNEEITEIIASEEQNGVTSDNVDNYSSDEFNSLSESNSITSPSINTSDDFEYDYPVDEMPNEVDNSRPSCCSPVEA